MKKDKFLTIGALAKTTGTKVKALRYYEKIGVLIPSYVDSDNGYRYYSRRHIYIVEAIRLCADLNIPLNEFKKFISEDESQDRKSTRLNSSHSGESRMPSSA